MVGVVSSYTTRDIPIVEEQLFIANVPCGKAYNGTDVTVNHRVEEHSRFLYIVQITHNQFRKKTAWWLVPQRACEGYMA